MKQTNPIESLLRILIVGCFAITTMAYFIVTASKSETPMDRHVEYILEKHNDNCQYEQGECPQSECSHSEPPVQLNGIIKQTTDDRGLTSVVYLQNGHELALDYLSRIEYDSLLNVLTTHK